MMRVQQVSAVFWIAAIYDGILGLGFALVPERLFAWAEVTPPNHYGYVRFPALLLITFALMFVAVARQPRANANLIPYGILMKLSYASLVFWYWITAGLPDLWKPFAMADTVFAVVFYLAYRSRARE